MSMTGTAQERIKATDLRGVTARVKYGDEVRLVDLTTRRTDP
jgi:hypothetical protein